MAKLKVGDIFPNFTCNTAFEANTSIADIVGGKTTILWVLRYIGCTVCRYDVNLLSKRYKEFQDKGVNVAIVMQSDPAIVRKELEEQPLPFSIICDTDMEIYKTLEIDPADSMEALLGDGMDKLQAKGAAAEAAGFSHGEYEGDEQQLPALFIVDGNLKATYVHYAKDIMDMPTIDDLLSLV